MMTMAFLSLNTALIFFVLLKNVANSQDCYANLTDPYSYFATKTGYFKVDNESADEIKFPGVTLS